jgi:hypothetical protein
MNNKKTLHKVSHHNMYGVSCEVAGANNVDDFKLNDPPKMVYRSTKMRDPTEQERKEHNDIWITTH